MDRKIELEQISDEMFNELLLTVNTEVLDIAREAQNKINELLNRFNVQCSLSLSYSEHTVTILDNLPKPVTVQIPKKKKSSRKKKKES